MEKTTVFENGCATMVYYPEVKVVHNTFRGQPTSEQFRSALDAGVETMKKYGGSKWVSDDRENPSVYSAEDRAWADHDWFPRMLTVGWKTWAMVVPLEVKAQINMIEIIDKIYERGIRVRVFSKLDEALEWLFKAE